MTCNYSAEPVLSSKVALDIRVAYFCTAAPPVHTWTALTEQAEGPRPGQPSTSKTPAVGAGMPVPTTRQTVSGDPRRTMTLPLRKDPDAEALEQLRQEMAPLFGAGKRGVRRDPLLRHTLQYPLHAMAPQRPSRTVCWHAVSHVKQAAQYLAGRWENDCPCAVNRKCLLSELSVERSECRNSKLCMSAWSRR